MIRLVGADQARGGGIGGGLPRSARQFFASFDVFVMPTVPILPPAIASLEADDAAFAAANALVLRNPSVVNFLDGCAVSVPCHREGDAQVGLSVCGFHGQDETILALARAVETALGV
jgi:aspartyl-tRNA(Asn)/glutamyl-tRNA(Gln) amidotransferase subunit A